MKNGLSGLILCLVFAAYGHGAPAVFKDNVLTIDEGIVVEQKESSYYENIRLTVKPDGDFRLLDAERRTPAHVDEFSIAVIETMPVQVEVLISGYKSTPCVELEYAVAISGTTFHVVVVENPLQTLVACIQIIEPYELLVPLDVTGLAGGEYLVNVNGKETGFSL